MAGCSALGKARIEVGILVKIGWLGSPKMSVPGIAPNGKPRPSLDRSRPGKSKNVIFGKKTVVFKLCLAIFHYLGVPPGVHHPALCYSLLLGRFWASCLHVGLNLKMTASKPRPAAFRHYCLTVGAQEGCFAKVDSNHYMGH